MIEVETNPGWRKIVLNRPERLNALCVPMMRAFLAALDMAEADPGTRALLLTGNGRGFCAGQELGPEVAVGVDLEAFLNGGYHDSIRRLRASRLPIVCAVNGVAAGAGASLALACDIVVAAKSARFVQAFVKIGLVPDCGASFFLTRAIGEARARALAMTGAAIDAATAASWGMIWKAVDDTALMTEAETIVEGLANAPAAALTRIKTMFATAGTNTLDTQLDLEARLQGQSGRTADYAEGVRAFQEKRAPVFNG